MTPPEHCQYAVKEEVIRDGPLGAHGEPPIGSFGFTQCMAPAGLPRCATCPRDNPLPEWWGKMPPEGG